jgi:hypothetical protein
MKITHGMFPPRLGQALGVFEDGDETDGVR